MFAKLVSGFFRRFTEWIELLYKIWTILRGILIDLIERRHFFDRLFADEKQLRPQPIKFFRIRIREHQPAEMLVFAVKQRQSDDLINRDDAHVTQGCREQFTELLEARLEPLANRTTIVHDDRDSGNYRVDRSGWFLRE